MYHIGRASGECLPALTAIVLTTRNYQLALLLREEHSKKGETPGPIAETLEGSKRRCRKKRNCRKRKTAMGTPRALAPREKEKKVLRFLMQPSLDEGNERGGVACGIIRHLYSLFPAVSPVGSSWGRLTLLPLTRNVVVSTTTCTSRSRHPRRSRSSEHWREPQARLLCKRS